jgi:hypothetical protein
MIVDRAAVSLSVKRSAGAIDRRPVTALSEEDIRMPALPDNLATINRALIRARLRALSREKRIARGAEGREP